MHRVVDDKAYLRPGTSIGASDAKAQTLLQKPGNERKLTWLFATPSSYRFIKKKQWSLQDIRHIYPLLESRGLMMKCLSDTLNQSCMRWNKMNTLFQKNFEVLQDKVTHFSDATTKKDILSVKHVDNCQFRQYEEQRSGVWLNLNFQVVCRISILKNMVVLPQIMVVLPTFYCKFSRMTKQQNQWSYPHFLHSLLTPLLKVVILNIKLGLQTRGWAS